MKARVEFKKLYSDSILPKKAHETDAGLDVYAYTANDFFGGVVDLKPGEIKMVKTGVAMSTPIGYETQVRPRSGLAAKHGISIVNSPGTIDSGFRLEICVILINLGQETYRVHHGDRIAQLVVQKLPNIDVIEVEELSPASERGEAGFGSSGR